MAIGDSLLGPPEPVSAFGPPEPDQGIAQGDQGPPQPGKFEQYKNGWRGFFNRVKTDPNTRMAVMQMVAGVAKDGNVGTGMEQGLNTLMGMKKLEHDQKREVGADARAERVVTAEEKKVGIEGQKVTQQGSQFDQNMGQQRAELDARLKELASSDAYRKGQLEVDWAKVNKDTSEGGQVNNRIKMVRDAMLQDPDADLAGIADPKARENRAFLRAFDLVNKPGQTRQQTIAKFLQDQQLFMADPKKKPDQYVKDMESAIARSKAIADAAGLTEETATPKGPPIGPNATAGAGAGGPLPVRPTLQAGQTLNTTSGGKPVSGKITGMTNETVTVDFGPPLGVKTLKRSAVEGTQSVQQ